MQFRQNVKYPKVTLFLGYQLCSLQIFTQYLIPDSKLDRRKISNQMKMKHAQNKRMKHMVQCHEINYKTLEDVSKNSRTFLQICKKTKSLC